MAYHLYVTAIESTMDKWKLTKHADDRFSFLVQYLDEEQEVIPFKEEAYQTFAQALARAEFMNTFDGRNVRVIQELAFCTK